MFESVVVGGARQTQGYGCTPFACSCQCEWACPGRCNCRGQSFHAGIDFAARAGTVLTAAGYGQVVAIGRGGGSCGGLGPMAPGIQSGGVVIWYGHASVALVSLGQLVTPGQPVARMGWLGCVYPQGPGGTHCHFEVDRADDPYNGCRSLDPTPYLTSWPGAAPVPPPGATASPGLPGLAWAALLAGGALAAYGLSRGRPGAS